MGFFSKIFKGVKKVFKKIGKGIRKLPVRSESLWVRLES